MSSPIYLSELPNAKALEWVSTGAPVVACFNPVEYHGPHLPLDTDTLLSLGVLQSMQDQVRETTGWDLLIHSMQRVGCGAVPTHGTIRTRYKEVRRIVIDTCHAIRGIGAKRAILMTFHGEPFHNLAIQDGVDLLRSWGIPAFAPMNVVMNETLNYLPDHYADAHALIADPKFREWYRENLVYDFHGGLFEGSLMLHWHPETVASDHRTLPPCGPGESSRVFLALARFFRRIGRERLAREMEFANAGVAWSSIRPTCGYTGNPAFASRDLGAMFASRITRLVEDAYLSYFQDGILPPGPILRWVRPVSLGGLFGP